MTLTINDALEGATIRSVFKEENVKIGFAVVQTLVNRFMDSFGFSSKPSPSQIEMITVDILDNFQYESLEDVILFLKMARNGTLGVAKKGIDSNLLIGEWLPIYLEKKAIRREEIHQQQKANESKNLLSIDEIKQAYSIAKKENIKKGIDYVENITKDIDRQMLEDLIIEWSKCEKRKLNIDLLKQKRREILWKQ